MATNRICATPHILFIAMICASCLKEGAQARSLQQRSSTDAGSSGGVTGDALGSQSIAEEIAALLEGFLGSGSPVEAARPAPLPPPPLPVAPPQRNYDAFIYNFRPIDFSKLDASPVQRPPASPRPVSSSSDSSTPPQSIAVSEEQTIGSVLDGLLARSQQSWLIEAVTVEDDSPREYSLYENTECVASRVILEREGVSSVEACQNICDNWRKQCRAFTFNPETRKCFLVPDCKDRAHDSGNISGVEASLAGDPFVDEERGKPEEPKAFNVYRDTGCTDGSFSEVNGVWQAQDCQALCFQQDTCKAYTHNPRKFRCFLATSCVTREVEEGNVAGVEKVTDKMASPYNLYERTGCMGDSIAHRGSYSSVADCQAWCDRRDGCEAFTYNPQRRRCYLKRDCEKREVEPGNTSGVKLAVDECSVSPPCATNDPTKLCLQSTEKNGEMADPVVGTFEPPYNGIEYEPTYKKRKEYPTCNFQPPRDPVPIDWVDQCIENARGVGFLKERKRRPNDECPAGWFLCKGMCYPLLTSTATVCRLKTLVQRNNRGPDRTWYYDDDFMFVESRCGLCGGARVAFVGDDSDMQRVAAEAARQTINEDEASWVRRFRFLDEPNRKVEQARPYQPWHLYVEMWADNKEKATYQRYYTGSKDGREQPGWDARYRNQEGSILCVNTLQRIRQAVKYPDESNLTMERGCRGANHHEMWDNDEHRWRPEHHYPFPGH